MLFDLLVQGVDLILQIMNLMIQIVVLFLKGFDSQGHGSVHFFESLVLLIEMIVIMLEGIVSLLQGGVALLQLQDVMVEMVHGVVEIVILIAEFLASLVHYVLLNLKFLELDRDLDQSRVLSLVVLKLLLELLDLLVEVRHHVIILLLELRELLFFLGKLNLKMGALVRKLCYFGGMILL